MNRKEIAIRQFAALGIALLAAMFVVAHCAGCAPPSAAEKQVGAAALYEEQQRACVAQYADTAHIDACREKVKANWATDAGAKDGAS